ncbi:hypothetical protein [Amylibacter sp. IMCC11727]|uniref:hypothetical protein n=1 Tax=Amylibacter sp. IMCC11727 TaxID=3039851 RepID=UPI00244DD1B5|nr:hypothetical protein [Amylibacter sp. IMCC11727]WGI20382.1 hypothetical protein QBD29_09635 [Amylibacter sp. IMCC11727]
MEAIQFLNSPMVQRICTGLFFVAMGAAIAFGIYAMSLYGRAKETELSAKIDPPWELLIATWRDSLIITVLFVCEGFLYRMVIFSGFINLHEGSYYRISSLVDPIASLIILLLITYIAIARIIKLRIWMQANGIE